MSTNRNEIARLKQAGIRGDNTSRLLATALEGNAVHALVYRPGDPHGSRDNVFVTWAEVMAAVAATKGQGYRQIQFDNSYAPNPSTDPQVAPYLAYNTVVPGQQLSRWPCAITPPPAGQAWDMTDVVWTDRGLSPGLDSTMVQIYDGGPGRPCHIDNLKRIDAMILGIIYNGKTVGNHPFVTSRSTVSPAGAFYGWVFEGVRLRVYNTDATAQPIWKSDAATSFLDLQNNSIIGLNPYAPTSPSPAPVFEIASGATLVLFGKRTTSVANNTFSGPAGSTLQIDTYFSEVWGDAENAMLQWVMPNFSGAIAALKYECATQRFRPSSAVLTASGAAYFGEVCQVNSSTGAVTVTLPKSKVTAPTTGSFPWEGTCVTVLDVGGAAVTHNITVIATVGDSINGNVEAGANQSAVTLNTNYSSLRFWPDGKGAWFILA